jgi:hypothetical protein
MDKPTMEFWVMVPLAAASVACFLVTVWCFWFIWFAGDN